jgi:hypothetical protein
VAILRARFPRYEWLEDDDYHEDDRTIKQFARLPRDRRRLLSSSVFRVGRAKNPQLLSPLIPFPSWQTSSIRNRDGRRQGREGM